MCRRRPCDKLGMIARKYGRAEERCPRTGLVEQIQHFPKTLCTDIKLFGEPNRMVVLAWQIKLLNIKGEEYLAIRILEQSFHAERSLATQFAHAGDLPHP